MTLSNDFGLRYCWYFFFHHSILFRFVLDYLFFQGGSLERKTCFIYQFHFGHNGPGHRGIFLYRFVVIVRFVLCLCNVWQQLKTLSYFNFQEFVVAQLKNTKVMKIFVRSMDKCVCWRFGHCSFCRFIPKRLLVLMELLICFVEGFHCFC